jgi:hypothetical protein
MLGRMRLDKAKRARESLILEYCERTRIRMARLRVADNRGIPRRRRPSPEKAEACLLYIEKRRAKRQAAMEGRN